MSNDLYDLLCGHEVGHALWTPADDNKVKVKGLPHSYLNVIEDIRIDKKMKIKYPGLSCCWCYTIYSYIFLRKLFT